MLGLSTNSVYIFLIVLFLVFLVVSIIAQNRIKLENTLSSSKGFAEDSSNTHSVDPAPVLDQQETLVKDMIYDFRYPGSELISVNSDSLSLSSNDDVDLVTSWYTNKIRDLNLNSISKILTNSNDNVLNTISASNNSQSIYIQISKRSGSNITKIAVER